MTPAEMEKAKNELWEACMKQHWSVFDNKFKKFAESVQRETAKSERKKIIDHLKERKKQMEPFGEISVAGIEAALVFVRTLE